MALQRNVVGALPCGILCLWLASYHPRHRGLRGSTGRQYCCPQTATSKSGYC